MTVVKTWAKTSSRTSIVTSSQILNLKALCQVEYSETIRKDIDHKTIKVHNQSSLQTWRSSSYFELKRNTLKALWSRFSDSIFSIRWPACHKNDKSRRVPVTNSKHHQQVRECDYKSRAEQDSQLYFDSWPTTLSCSSTKMHLWNYQAKHGQWNC
jgi:hypothetical protein